MRDIETAFHTSQFRKLVVEATDDSLNLALDLFNDPDGVDVSLRGRPPVLPSHEVACVTKSK